MHSSNPRAHDLSLTTTSGQRLTAGNAYLSHETARREREAVIASAESALRADRIAGTQIGGPCDA